MFIIFKRQPRRAFPKYLGSRYQWGNLPHGFHDWQADGLQAMIQRMPDAPTHYAVVENTTVLDSVEWTKI